VAGTARQQQAEQGVQFIDASIGRDARMILGDPAAVAEPGFALIAGFGVDARKVDHDDLDPRTKARGR